jgi:hypothetical protein
MSTDHPAYELSEATWTALRSFSVDAITAEVVGTLEARSIKCILLKGPTIAAWLYAHDRPRLYSDTDLLVERSDWDRAMAVLEELGFRDALGPLAHPRMESGAGHPWKRAGDRAEVDLHYTLFGLTAPPERVWDLIASGAERMNVGGAEVLTMNHPARLLHVCLHAVQHGGRRQAKPMIDLTQAIRLGKPADWSAATRLAGDLGATGTFAAALALLPEGRALAAELDVASEPSITATLRIDSTPTAEGFAELAAAKGVPAKIRLVRREAFPGREFMRWWTPIARRGRIGMLVAYCWRLTWLATHAIPGIIAWLRLDRPARERLPYK